MKTTRKKLIVILIAVLLVGQAALIAYARSSAGADGQWDGEDSPLDLETYTVVPYSEAPDPTGITLQPGEIWAGRSVKYNYLMDEEGRPIDTNGELLTDGTRIYDGTVTARLYVWGARYTHTDDGQSADPLDPEKDMVYFRSSFNDFFFRDEPQFQFVPDGTYGTYYETGEYGEHYIIWAVPQAEFLDAPEPIYAEVTLWLEERPQDDPDYTPLEAGVWYTSGSTEVWFYPAEDNTYYWTKEIITEEAFTFLRFNYNANGLNDATLIDRLLNITIEFGGVKTVPGSGTATVGNTRYTFTLVRNGGNWEITVLNLGGPGIHMTYEALGTSTTGGNMPIPGNRITTSENYMQRNRAPNGSPITWSTDPNRENAVVINMGGSIQMQVAWQDARVGDLTLYKSLAGYYAMDWRVTRDTEFTVLLTHEGRYLTFSQDAVTGEYTYTGLIAERDRATVVRFTADTPAILKDIPVASDTNPESPYWIFEVEEIFDYALADWEDSLDLITYTVHEIGGEALREYEAETEEGPLPDPISMFTLTGNDNTDITVQNTFSHGVGFLRVFKTLEGYESDHNVDRDTVFYVRIWDVEAENYLLFDPVPRDIYKDETDPIDRGTLWCVGNHIVGLTEAFTGTPIMDIPITANTPLRLSNLWTWSAYEVHEVIPVGGGAVDAAFFDDWNDFWNDPALDRDFYWNDRFHDGPVERYGTDINFY